MEKLSEEEQLRAILMRLMEIRRQGGAEGINEKIAEVQLELRKHLQGQSGKGKNK